VVTTLYGRARALLLAPLAAAVVLVALSGSAPAQADSLFSPPAISSADWAPVGVDIDKGAPPPAGVKSAARKAGSAAKAADCETPCYFYNTGRQEVTNTGAYATVWIDQPALAVADYHTLAELSVQSSLNGIRQIVEIGWSIDRDINKDDKPHLFVYHWVNNVGGCYNGCGFVVSSDAKVLPGAALTPGAAKRFAIQYFGGNWWVNYDNAWLGYFPGKLWSSEGVDFTSAGAYQLFGEVAATTDQPCTDMGNGTAGSAGVAGSPRPAFFSGAAYFDPAGVSTTSKLFTTTQPAVGGYTIGPVSDRAFYYGGDGFGPC
jgi:hypothetical protein